ncbi:hypothetical protein Psi02_80090 [Planotetraspora silvatica]|uniref:Novel STAND NTPase 3 domain-containing protein n=2 Tax=Planotetraspora silvatica TaxID=234614 RepID=A0A8J3V7R8_9ACTN|nr:hypothetical protein Psi02_80090 [Planotetraspora silvatica]
MRVLGIPQQDVWGPERLNAALGKHSDVERRHPKLWLSSSGVLESIVNAGCWNRSEAELSAIAERAKFWVETSSYSEVVSLLDNEGVCVVSGAPGVGKTYLADMVALQRAHSGWQVVHVSNIEQAWSIIRNDERPQLFIYNDFLGEAELKLDAKSEAPGVTNFIRDIIRRKDANKRLIITTRVEVLQQAVLAATPSLQRIANDDTGRLLIKLSDWDEPTRMQVVLNHLYFAGLPEEELSAASVDRRLLSVIRHRSYNPYLIEVICDRFDAATTADDALSALMAALDFPETVWFASFAVLNLLATEIILTMATMKPGPVSIEMLRALVGDQGSATAWGDAWRSLEPTWVMVSGPPTARALAFAHPGCRDYILGRLDLDSDMAGERVERARMLEQFAELASASGDLWVDAGVPPLVRRAVIADAMKRRRGVVAEKIRLFTEQDVASSTTTEGRLRLLVTSAALIGLYGSADDSRWLTELVGEQIRDLVTIPASDGFALAVQLARHSPSSGLAEVTQRLATAAAASTRTVGDLDAYEAFAAEVTLPVVADAIRPLAYRIIMQEIDDLYDERDAQFVRDSAHDLQARASLYGHELDIDTVLEHADYLAQGR